MRQVGSEAVRRCDAATLRDGFRVFAVSRRCDAARWLVDGFVSSRCRDAAGGSSRLRVFATLRRCDAEMLCHVAVRLVSLRRCDGVRSSRLRVFATLRHCDAAGGLVASSRLRVFASSRGCDAARLASSSRLASSRHQIWLRAAARFFAMARCCVDASDAATLQPWGGWWVGLHAVVTSMYWLKRWGLDQIFIFANKQ